MTKRTSWNDAGPSASSHILSMSYPPNPTLLNRNEVLNQLYLERGIVFQNAVKKQLKVERETQASSGPSSFLEVETENESFKNNMPPAGEGLKYQTPRLFALIIGINVYRMNFRTLRGAVPDGKAFKAYLMKRLGVPENHIITLFDHDATRAEIIKGFRKLRDNGEIKEGDPIFIFFAGHGSQKSPHPGWGLGGRNVQIEVILPYDCGALTEEHPKGVEPIPDLTIGILIDEIAAKKGNNITVVFDCCHSASGTRSENENSLTLVRSAQLENVPFREETDWEIRGSVPRSAHPNEAYLRRGLRSHMLIAACSSSEDAMEYNGRGKLSTALLKLLDNTSPDKLRYRDILANMEPIPPQNPQCEGHSQDRLLFNGKVLLPRGVYPIRFDSDTSRFTLRAGAAHGIAIGAEFTAYSDPDKLLNPLGTFVVETLRPFESDIKQVTPLSRRTFPSQGASAIQTKAGKVEPFRLYVPPKDRFHREYHSIRASTTTDLRSVFLVNNPGEAHLMVFTSLPDGHLTFLHTDKRVTQHGMKLVRGGVSSDPLIVGGVLETAANYFRELNRTTTSHDIAAYIDVEFYKLEVPKFRIADHPMLKPVEPNLCRQNIIDIVVNNAKTPYGFKIINKADEDLYVNAFYFDNTDFRIVRYYTTTCPGGEHSKLESPLKGNGELCVGYGPGGWPPLAYEIRKGQDLDVGFLKIYLSTQPVDLSRIEQQSAFLENRGATVWRPEPQDVWDTILIPIIQRRNPS